MSSSARDLQTLFEVGSLGGLSDGQLLDRFLARKEMTVFEAVVLRHGPMVWGVCRRVLRDQHDAEDAFQATFLVLARKASSIKAREKLGNWLYGVAYQTAMKARATKVKRRQREVQVADIADIEVVGEVQQDERLPELDRELSRLPEKYRVPIVLCELEGKSHKEAAEQLGWPIGTVSGRLSRAKAMLAKRLSDGETTHSVGLLSVLLAKESASACMTATLVSRTAEAVSLVAAGRAVAAGVVSAEVVALTQEGLKTMLLSKSKAVSLALLIGTALIGGGTGILGYRAFGSTKQDSIPNQPSSPAVRTGVIANPVRSGEELMVAYSRVNQTGYDQSLASFREGKFDVEMVHLWSQRLMESQSSAATGSYVDDPKSRDIILAAANAHLDRMKQLDELCRTLMEKKTIYPLTKTTAEYYLILAESQILEYSRGKPKANEEANRPK